MALGWLKMRPEKALSIMDAFERRLWNDIDGLQCSTAKSVVGSLRKEWKTIRESLVNWRMQNAQPPQFFENVSEEFRRILGETRDNISLLEASGIQAIPQGQNSIRRYIQPHAEQIADNVQTGRQFIIATGNKDTLLTPIYARWIIKRDMAEILAIEQATYRTPWTEKDFLQYLRQRNCIGLVAEHCDTIVGFMIFEMYKRAFEVMNFAVHPNWRRSLVGTQLLQTLVSKLRHEKRREAGILTRESNTPMHMLLRQRGFRATEVVREYYKDSGEDAYRFQYRLGSSRPGTIPVS